MFNPQRKAKVSDIYMQEKIYNLHLNKMNKIEHSASLRSKRYQEEQEQKRILFKLEKSKREVRERISSDIRKQNHRLVQKLTETDHRASMDPEKQLPSRKDHFNSYFSNKRERERVYNDNYTMVMRMDRCRPEVPSLKQLKSEYKQSRRYKKNCRKLPSIVKHEQQFKKKLSTPLFESFSRSNSKSKDLKTINHQ